MSDNIKTKEDALTALNNLKSDFEKRESELRKTIENFDKPTEISYKDVTNIDVAEEILKDLKCGEHIKYTENQFCRKIDWIGYKLQTMIKAVNYLANGNKTWEKNWDNSSEYYYIPYFDMRNGSFSYFSYYPWLTYSTVGFGWGFKSKELLLHGVKYWLDDYKIYHKGK